MAAILSIGFDEDPTHIMLLPSFSLQQISRTLDIMRSKKINIYRTYHA